MSREAVAVTPEWMQELSRLRTPFVVAGGSMLNLVVFGEDAISDVDIFSPHPEEIIKELGVNAEKNGIVYKAGGIEFVEFPDVEGDYVSQVIGAFDFNVTTCGWDGLIEDEPMLCASELFIEAISTGLLELLPHINLLSNRSRTAFRAAKFMKRLSYNLGERLETFLLEFLKDMRFEMRAGRVFERGPLLEYTRVPLSGLQKMVVTVNGPSHPLCLTAKEPTVN